jgi:hypothetical protein
MTVNHLPKLQRLLQGVDVLRAINAAQLEKVAARKASIAKEIQKLLSQLQDASWSQQIQSAQLLRFTRLCVERESCDSRLKTLEKERLKLQRFEDGTVEKMRDLRTAQEEDDLLEIITTWLSNQTRQPAASSSR